MKTRPRVILVDAMFTLFVALWDRWILYQDVLWNLSRINAPVEEIETCYKQKRKEAEAAEKKSDEKLPPGYYRKYWGDINSQIIQQLSPSPRQIDAESALLQGEQFYIEVMGNPRYYQLAEGAREFLEQAKAKGYLLGLVTNQEQESISRLLDHFEIAGFFNKIIVSDTVGYKKPDGRFFEEAIAEFRELTDQNLTITDVAFIGNNPKNDMEGAASAGIINRFYLDPKGEHKDTGTKVAFQPINKIGEVLNYF